MESCAALTARLRLAMIRYSAIHGHIASDLKLPAVEPDALGGLFACSSIPAVARAAYQVSHWLEHISHTACRVARGSGRHCRWTVWCYEWLTETLNTMPMSTAHWILCVRPQPPVRWLSQQLSDADDDTTISKRDQILGKCCT